MADAYKLKGKTWKNRIVGYGVEDPTQLLANENNPRTHPKFQQDVLTGVLNEIGWIDDVIVNVRSGEEWPDGERGVQTMVDGHLRVTLALRNGEPQVPVKYVDLTPAEEALALATFDPISALAELQTDAFETVLGQIETNDADIQALLDQLGDVTLDSEADQGAVNEEIDADPQESRATELMHKWGTAPGQLWGMRKHTICPKCGKRHDL